jgi:hypothetical protein
LDEFDASQRTLATRSLTPGDAEVWASSARAAPVRPTRQRVASDADACFSRAKQ